MEAVSFAFALVAALDLCLKYGEKLEKRFKAYKNADSEVGDIFLRVQHQWHCIQIELSMLRNITHLLEDEAQIHFSSMFHKLHIYLEDVARIIDGLIENNEETPKLPFLQLMWKKGKVKKLKFAVEKDALEQALLRLEEWHWRLQPSLFLLALVKTPAVESQLAVYKDKGNPQVCKVTELRSAIQLDTTHQDMPSIFISASTLAENRTPILYTRGELTQGAEDGESLYVETYTPDPWTGLEVITKNVRNLARILSVVDPTLFGIPVCSGIVKVYNANGCICDFKLVFRLPDLHDRTPPRSLREVLLTSERYPLEKTLALGRQLSKSVMFVHTSSFVHKNIRPETILILSKAGPSGSIAVPFLVGFEQFRPEDGATYMKGDSAWEKDLYRHPTRQGLSPEDSYRMQHDIYSLGVILLEIGLWESLVVRDDKDGKWRPGDGLNISRYLIMRRQTEKARGIKEELLQIAKTRLPAIMGPKYTQIVVMCLCCLDKGSSNEFGQESEFLDEDGILVGLRYIEKVITKLEEIVV
ncbi:hypothetical protein EV426DRAFT_623739 [Tirmania nivea]|nr:hypothetical protein EV426DRAFT_623739 [Tirmania nivea]